MLLKRSITLFSLLAMLLPAIAGTPKENFHSYESVEMLLFDHSFLNDEEQEELATDVHRYVLGELLPSMDSGSVAYVDTLLRYVDYISWLSSQPLFRDDRIACSQQARRIALRLEGKGERYFRALDSEIGAITYYAYTNPCPEIKRSRQLLEQLVNDFHETRRPTDPDYLGALNGLYYCVFVDEICPDMHNDLKAEMHVNYAYAMIQAAFVWNDLLRWEDITLAEYDSVCHNYLSCAYDYSECLSMYSDHREESGTWSYNTFTYAGAATCPKAYAMICRAHDMLLYRTGAADTWRYLACRTDYPKDIDSIDVSDLPEGKVCAEVWVTPKGDPVDVDEVPIYDEAE